MIFNLQQRIAVPPLLASIVICVWCWTAIYAKPQVVGDQSKHPTKAQPASEDRGNVLRTTVCEIVSAPSSFDGMMIELRGDVFAGLENNILYDRDCKSKGRLPSRIEFTTEDVPKTGREFVSPDENREYRKFWKLLHAYTEPSGKRHSIMPDKYTVTATLCGRFDTMAPSRQEIGFGGKLVLKSVRDVVARPFDASFLTDSKNQSSARDR